MLPDANPIYGESPRCDLHADLHEIVATHCGEKTNLLQLLIEVQACIGMCDQGPALLVNGRAITRLTSQRIQEIGQLICNRTPVAEWPADYFKVENNIRRSGLILDNKLAYGEVLQAAKAISPETIIGTRPDGRCDGGGFCQAEGLKVPE